MSEENLHSALLVDAISRHLANEVASYHTKIPSNTVEKFDGINERTAVAVLAKVFEGLGYWVYYEQQVLGQGEKIDLCVLEPDGKDAWLVEAKMVWDGTDHRLYRDRADCYMHDLRRLIDCKSADGRRLAVWFAFSAQKDIECLGDEVSKMRLSDLINKAKSEYPTFRMSKTVVDLAKYGPCNEATTFAHVISWELT